MIEYWACFGLACMDSVFLEKLEEASEKDASKWDSGNKDKADVEVASVVRAYGFRLSHFELAELAYCLRYKPEVIVKLKEIHHIWCPPPPRPCPFEHAVSDNIYSLFKERFIAFREKLNSPDATSSGP